MKDWLNNSLSCLPKPILEKDGFHGRKDKPSSGRSLSRFRFFLWGLELVPNFQAASESSYLLNGARWKVFILKPTGKALDLYDSILNLGTQGCSPM